MRKIIKTIAQSGLSPNNRCRCSKGIGHWLHKLFLLILLSGWAAVLSAATPPDTELTNVVNVSYTVGAGAVVNKQAAVTITTTINRGTPAFTEFWPRVESSTVPPTSSK